MNGTTDDLYFEWLYGLIGVVRNRNPARSYWSFARQLYTKEFLWSVPNDGNRLMEGKELRDEFVREQENCNIDPAWMDIGCSMLEMLISLSRRLGYQLSKPADECFRIFMENLELNHYTDEAYSKSVEKKVDKALDRVINRTYLPNGSGGLFPLKRALQDQRRIELWYQMSAFVIESWGL